MTSKLFIFAVLVTLACAHGRNTAPNTRQDMQVAQKEDRTLLLEVPLIGTVLMVAFKIAGLVMNAIGPLLKYKLAAFTLITNVISLLHQYYFPIIVGTAVVLGFCVITSTFTQEPEYEMNHRLIQAARHLDMGSLKYARMIN